MSIEQFVNRYARGTNQRAVAYELACGRRVYNFTYGLRGWAQTYRSHYTSSFYNLLERLRADGFVIQRELGPRGGLHSATYKLLDVGYITR